MTPIDFKTAAEWEIQAYLVHELAKLGLFVAEVNYTLGNPSAVSRTTPGFPDLAIIGMGRVHLWECKSKEGRLSDTQRIFHKKAKDVGYYVPVVRSLDDALNLYDVQFRHARRCSRCGAIIA